MNRYNPKEIEPRWQKWWDEHGTYTADLNSDKPKYIAMSMFNATVGALVSIYRTLWKIATLPLLFASGVLYMPSSMPPEVQSVIIWNPFLHCVEALRSTSYLDYMSLYDPVYLHTFATAVLLLSLAVERLFRKEIIRAKGDDDDEEEV